MAIHVPSFFLLSLSYIFCESQGYSKCTGCVHTLGDSSFNLLQMKRDTGRRSLSATSTSRTALQNNSDWCAAGTQINFYTHHKTGTVMSRRASAAVTACMTRHCFESNFKKIEAIDE